MRRIAISMLVAASFACSDGGKKKNNNDGPEPGGACDTAGLTACYQNWVLLCDGSRWTQSQDCGTQQCQELSASPGVFACLAPPTAAGELEACGDGIGVCNDGLECSPTAFGASLCVDERRAV